MLATSTGKFSLTYTGIIVSVVGYLLNKFGVPFESGQVEVVVANGVIVAGWVIAIIGRWRHGDISVCGFKKKAGDLL